MAKSKTETLKHVLTDADLRAQAKDAAQSVHKVLEEAKAAKKIVEQPKPVAKKKKHRLRTVLVVATIGAVVAMVVNEDARKVVLDALFGAEEEFQYTSHASTASSTNGAS